MKVSLHKYNDFHPWKTSSYMLAGTAKALPKLGIDMEGISYAHLDALAVHPCQMPISQGPRETPERRLMAALLADAVYLATRQIAYDAVHEARHWIASSNRSHIFAFLTVCEILGFDPELVRAYVARAPQFGNKLRMQVSGRYAKVRGTMFTGRTRTPKRWER